MATQPLLHHILHVPERPTASKQAGISHEALSWSETIACIFEAIDPENTGVVTWDAFEAAIIPPVSQEVALESALSNCDYELTEFRETYATLVAALQDAVLETMGSNDGCSGSQQSSQNGCAAETSNTIANSWMTTSDSLLALWGETNAQCEPVSSNKAVSLAGDSPDRIDIQVAAKVTRELSLENDVPVAGRDMLLVCVTVPLVAVELSDDLVEDEGVASRETPLLRMELSAMQLDVDVRSAGIAVALTLSDFQIEDCLLSKRLSNERRYPFFTWHLFPTSLSKCSCSKHSLSDARPSLCVSLEHVGMHRLTHLPYPCNHSLLQGWHAPWSRPPLHGHVCHRSNDTNCCDRGCCTAGTTSRPCARRWREHR